MNGHSLWGPTEPLVPVWGQWGGDPLWNCNSSSWNKHGHSCPAIQCQPFQGSQGESQTSPGGALREPLQVDKPWQVDGPRT